MLAIGHGHEPLGGVERPRQHVPIAGVPWPAYKLVALAVGLVTLLGVGDEAAVVWCFVVAEGVAFASLSVVEADRSRYR